MRLDLRTANQRYTPAEVAADCYSCARAECSQDLRTSTERQTAVPDLELDLDLDLGRVATVAAETCTEDSISEGTKHPKTRSVDVPSLPKTSLPEPSLPKRSLRKPSLRRKPTLKPLIRNDRTRRRRRSGRSRRRTKTRELLRRE